MYLETKEEVNEFSAWVRSLTNPKVQGLCTAFVLIITKLTVFPLSLVGPQNQQQLDPLIAHQVSLENGFRRLGCHTTNYKCRRVSAHQSGPLFPAEDRPPTYAQLYFYDSQAALEHRCHQNSGLNPDTLRTLQHHQYTSIYRHAYEILERYDPNEDVAIHLRVAPHHDRRRYNLPTADFEAA